MWRAAAQVRLDGHIRHPGERANQQAAGDGDCQQRRDDQEVGTQVRAEQRRDGMQQEQRHPQPERAGMIDPAQPEVTPYEQQCADRD